METILIDLPIPSMGATVSELTIIDIKVKPNEPIVKGQKLAELESDKSVFEFESPCDGQIQSIHARAGDILPSGTPFFSILTSDHTLLHLQSKTTPATELPKITPPSVSKITASPRQSVQWTPRASKLAQEAGLDPASITDIVGTGPGGRISGDDVAKYLQTHIATKTTAESQADESVRIAGIGYAVPKNIRSTSEILKAFPGRTEEQMIKLTGIHERRYADPDQSAASLAEDAVRSALSDAHIKVEDIDGIILATIIPDQPVPSMASALAKRLGIPHALAFDVNAACAGWLYALEIGRAFVRSGTAKRVLVVTAELLSRITNPNDHETAFLFGDGAGAAILCNDAGGHRLSPFNLSGDARQFDAIQRPGGGASRPIPLASGSDRNDFYLKMDGATVFKTAVVAFADQIELVLKRFKLTASDIDWIVPHQANERILRAVGKRVGIAFDRFVVTISKFGNTSGASVSMALGWAAQEGIFKPGDKIILCSVGAGMTFAGGLIIW